MVAQAYQLSRFFQRIFRFGLILILSFLSDLCLCGLAQAQTLQLISDEETELFLADILKPIFRSVFI